MATGFSSAQNFDAIIGWTLYQITIDKYHVMFWFNNEHALLNVANKFSFKSADGNIDFSYEVYGERKELNLDSILRVSIQAISVASKDRLDLVFENGDTLSIFDDPKFRSWWFMSGERGGPIWEKVVFSISDMDYSDLTQAEIAARTH